MPASSVSGMNSWGLYLFASVALVLVFTPQLSGVVQASRDSMDRRNLDGIRELVDALRPGSTVVFSYGIAGVSDSVRLGGRSIWCLDGNRTIAVPARWALQNATLAPGTRYQFALSQGEVSVEKVV